MEQGTATPLPEWETFCVIVGSAAAVLIGLQFVVVTLGSERGTRRTTTITHAFSTPTVVHFCAVLFIAAVLAAPWPTLLGPDLALGACGLMGVVYALYVVWQIHKQNDYDLVLEDWIFHVILPPVTYAALLISAITLRAYTDVSLFVAAGAAVLLLVIGIHNAYDSAVYIADTTEQSAQTSGNGDA